MSQEIDKSLTEQINKDSTNYRFSPVNINYKLGVRIANWWIGFCGRLNFLRTFCLDTGIDYPPKKHHRYHLPDKEYHISHDRIVYLGKLRDHIILVQNQRYVHHQAIAQCAADALNTELAHAEQQVLEIGAEISYRKRLLAHQKDAQKRLWLQSCVANCEAKLANRKEDYDAIELKLKDINAIIKKNRDNWGKQVVIIDDATEIAIKNFIAVLDKKVCRILNFTKFTHDKPAYSADIMKVLDGEIDA